MPAIEWCNMCQRWETPDCRPAPAGRAADRDASADVPEVLCPCGVSIEDCCVLFEQGKCTWPFRGMFSEFSERRAR